MLKLPLRIVVITSLAWAQRPAEKLNLPYGPVTRLASPDGSRILYGVPYQGGVQDEPELWIENTRTNQRQMLLAIPGTLSAAWSANGNAFYVEDHPGSDQTRSYIYDAHTLVRLDLAGRILASDSGVERFAEGHAYFDVDRWEGTEQVMVHLHGHTDAPPPVNCFDFRYRVSRAGAVTKVSQHTRQRFRCALRQMAMARNATGRAELLTEVSDRF